MILAKNFFEPIFFKPMPKWSLCITYDRKNKKKIQNRHLGCWRGSKNAKIRKITCLYTISFRLFLIILNTTKDPKELSRLHFYFIGDPFYSFLLILKLRKLKMNKIIISIIAIGNCLTKEDMIQSKEQVDDPLPSIGSVLDTLFTETTFQQNIITLFSVLMGGLIIVLLCCCCIVLTSPLLSFCLVWSRLQNVLGARFQRVKSELAAKSGQKNKTDNDTIIELSNSRSESRF